MIFVACLCARTASASISIADCLCIGSRRVSQSALFRMSLTKATCYLPSYKQSAQIVALSNYFFSPSLPSKPETMAATTRVRTAVLLVPRLTPVASCSYRARARRCVLSAPAVERLRPHPRRRQQYLALRLLARLPPKRRHLHDTRSLAGRGRAGMTVSRGAGTPRSVRTTALQRGWAVEGFVSMGMPALLRTVLSTMLPNRPSSTFADLASLTATWCGRQLRGG